MRRKLILSAIIIAITVIASVPTPVYAVLCNYPSGGINNTWDCLDFCECEYEWCLQDAFTGARVCFQQLKTCRDDCYSWFGGPPAN